MDYDQWVADQRAEREAQRKAERQAEREQRQFVDSILSDSRYVYCERLRCPECGDVKLRSYRSIDQGDGSRMKWTECKSCGEKFHLILE